MNNYDIIIIGGGISGFFCMYKLIKKFPRLKVLLLEKNKRFGGRIYTYCEKVDNINYCMDFGAGRLGFHHKLILNLLSELKLKKNIIKISNDKDYIEIINNKSEYKNDYRNKIMLEFFNFINSKKLDKISKSILLKSSLKDIINKYYKQSYFNDLEKVFEYYQDLYYFNSYDAINYFKNDYTNTAKYFTLKGGVYTIISSIISYIDKINKKYKTFHYYMNSKVNDIKFDNEYNLYKVNYNNKTVYSKYIICALPRKDLVKFDILKSYNKILNSVKDIDLMRIFEIYDNKNDVWFNNIKKTVTNDQLQFIIPINSNNGLIMSSYTELHNSKYWLKLYNKNYKNFKNTLNNKLSIAFNKHVPQSKWLKLHYWDMGVGSWKKNVNSDYISEKILNLLPNFYICGENYSKNQAWCEGSLDTASKVLDILFCKLNNTKKYTKKKYRKIKKNKTNKYIKK